MSDMIINDSVPVDKKWSELIRYNIFIMKLVEFVISLLLMILPFVLLEPAVVHCLAIAPTLVLSVMFVVLYLVDQVHNLAEQLYLFIQIALTIFAFCVIFVKPSPSGALYGLFYCHQLVALCIDIYYVIKERGFAVVALLLNILPHVVTPVDRVLQCLVAAPTLMLSAHIMVLYVVDQVQYEAESYYIYIQLTLTVLAILNLFIIGKLIGAIFGLFYVDLLIAFSMDLYYITKERGFVI